MSYHKAHTIKRPGNIRSQAHRCFGAGFVNPNFFSLYLILICIPNTISENRILSYSKALAVSDSNGFLSNLIVYLMFNTDHGF